MPLDAFREHAFVAGVNVEPDADGVVRSDSMRITTRGVTRPSIGAMLAEASGTGAVVAFPIDYAITADSIPRISFIDRYRGRAPATAIEGKRI